MDIYQQIKTNKMKNYLFLLNVILNFVCCITQNINLTNHQNSKNSIIGLKKYKNRIKRNCK